MKYVKMLGLAALSAMALMAFASTASATTLEKEGVTQTGAVTISSHIASGTSAVLKNTSSSIQNTCTTSAVSGTTSTFTGTPTGSVSSLTFESCTRNVTIHNNGKLFIEQIKKTTNGTVSSEEAEITVAVPPFGTYVNCKTNAGTDIGTLVGSASGHATMEINGVIGCGSLLPSAVWEGEYTVTSPTGLGVVS